MNALGHKQFFVLGHDRGGRVSHRLAMDFPQSVLKLMVLDISPTLTMYDQNFNGFCKGILALVLLIQPEPVPETLIGANPGYWLKNHMGRHAGNWYFSRQNAGLNTFRGKQSTRHACNVRRLSGCLND
jgi:haloacetate dehalogenase